MNRRTVLIGTQRRRWWRRRSRATAPVQPWCLLALGRGDIMSGYHAGETAHLLWLVCTEPAGHAEPHRCVTRRGDVIISVTTFERDLLVKFGGWQP